ncbi:MAG: carbonic anhydrase [Pirellulales bacterium]|nr:carbonic anhydrase [Pirellulales bacterium]
MEQLLQGIRAFREQIYPQHQAYFESLAAKQQEPQALMITCADSRIHPNLITQTEPGELFLIRNAGNIIPPYGSANGGEGATVEYSIEVLGIRNIILCGHSQCGAMTALMQHLGDSLPSVSKWFSHAEATRQIMSRKYPGLQGEELARRTAEENVLVQLNNLSTHPCVAARLACGDLHVYGWYYDIGRGIVAEYDQTRGSFVELDNISRPASPLPVTHPYNPPAKPQA